MNKLLFTLLLAISPALTACVCTKNHEAASVATGDPMNQSVRVGLAHYEPHSDVARLTSAVRHVLNPTGQLPATGNGFAAPSPSNLPDPGFELASKQRVSEAISITTEPSKVDTVYNTWRKYCDDASELSSKDWALIDATNMPAELDEIWSRECTPLK